MRGTLRVYLGAAPGVGKTYRMLDEGRRRRERGADVVVALVETHGRARTAEMVGDLEVVPRLVVDHRGTRLEEMDLDAVLARSPEVALVDELAHTNAPGSRHGKRWEDVEELLVAGIDVVTTVNVQHLESLRDVVAGITGVRQAETVPDHVVRAAEQVELVDMSPQALRRRMAHGDVYAAAKVDAALSQYFRVGNLTALRELALLWVADRVDAALVRYRADQGITTPWAARERVVVALTGGPEGEALVRRGARVAGRGQGGELVALHVAAQDGLRGTAPDALAGQRRLVEELGGTWHAVVGDDVAAAVLDFARGVNATQVVVGASRRSRLAAALSPGVGATVVRDSGDIDVQIVTHGEAGKALAAPARRALLGRRRRVAGWLLGSLGPVALSAVLVRAGAGDADLAVDLLLYLALTVGVAIVGGMGPAVLAAVLGGVLANVLLTPPLWTLTVARAQDAVALVVLVAVALAVSAVVDLAARRSTQAARARAESDVLSDLARSVLHGDDALPVLLGRLRELFGQRAVALLDAAPEGAPRPVLAAAGDPATCTAGAATTTVPVEDGLLLTLDGPPLGASDLRVLTAVAAQVGTVVERDRLRVTARSSRRERELTRVRTALLAAVSHDLRTPLAGVKAGVSALRLEGVELDAADRAELLADVEASADRLQALVDDLLDMSRLDAGVLVLRRRPVALDEVVPRAVAGLPDEGARRVRLDVPEELPLVPADAGLLVRCLGNVLENAVRHSPPSEPVVVAAGQVGRELHVHVVDRGPGVPEDRLEQIFTAFERLRADERTDARSSGGSGLGLAVARGFAEAHGGSLDAEATPGGGLTLVLRLPLDAPPEDTGSTPAAAGAAR
ncbi:ATP-binding protein [Pseudokineococcus lusitanus]|uniref:histidine kinase n=1 Tax=Pseudokineococcus lusitanus TaxID=763993 RepID=A0A3N1HQ89_9ACTN|nr:ATP-binding protein [Pseudokineococcus lusitanus]ROP44661.1 two-component system sensor histidine kinase KdpD [Pseudokineococcus lusitanus]